MPYDLSVRLSHKFVGTYQHEDRWLSFGDYEVIATGTAHSEDEDDYCESMVEFHTVRVTLNPDRSIDYTPDGKPVFLHQDKTIERALLDGFTAWGCAHEYDCCGCRSWSATSAHKLGDSGLWLVTVHSSRNF